MRLKRNIIKSYLGCYPILVLPINSVLRGDASVTPD